MCRLCPVHGTGHRRGKETNTKLRLPCFLPCFYTERRRIAIPSRILWSSPYSSTGGGDGGGGGGGGGRGTDGSVSVYNGTSVNVSTVVSFFLLLFFLVLLLLLLLLRFNDVGGARTHLLGSVQLARSRAEGRREGGVLGRRTLAGADSCGFIKHWRGHTRILVVNRLSSDE